MYQPDLGLKVVELRQEKGLTQEQLAELCEVSARTIQRIESGEVDPRAYTLQCLGKALEFDFGAQGNGDENFWLAVLHLSSIVPLVIVPLLAWSLKKDQSFKIDRQGRLVLNFQVTMSLCLFAATFALIVLPLVLTFVGMEGLTATEAILVFCTPIPLVLIGIFSLYQGIANTMRALSDKPVHYALSIPFMK
jgi:uncharacterized Tic20 family protein